MKTVQAPYRRRRAGEGGHGAAKPDSVIHRYGENHTCVISKWEESRILKNLLQSILIIAM
jgi:hypothetical protein